MLNIRNLAGYSSTAIELGTNAYKVYNWAMNYYYPKETAPTIEVAHQIPLNAAVDNKVLLPIKDNANAMLHKNIGVIASELYLVNSKIENLNLILTGLTARAENIQQVVNTISSTAITNRNTINTVKDKLNKFYNKYFLVSSIMAAGVIVGFVVSKII